MPLPSLEKKGSLETEHIHSPKVHMTSIFESVASWIGRMASQLFDSCYIELE
jgi:hypothetical protein